MKILCIAAGMMLLAINVTAQIKVPVLVENAFKQKFTNATSVTWSKENKNEYEVNFVQNNKKAAANFNTKAIGWKRKCK